MKIITVGYNSFTEQYGIIDGLVFNMSSADFVSEKDHSLEGKVRDFLDKKGFLKRKIAVQYYQERNGNAEYLADLICQLNTKAKKIKIKGN